jgi:sugar phosphate isomerase/epimerase
MGYLKGVDFPEFCVKNFQINKFEYIEDDFYPPQGSEHWHNRTIDEYINQNINQICAKVKEAKIGSDNGKIICIALRNDFTESEDAKRQDDVECIKKWLARAKENEIPLVRIYIGRRPLVNKDIRENVIKCIDEILPIAESAKVKLAVENHGGRNENPEDIAYVIDHFKSPWLGVCLDLGNIYKDRLKYYLSVLAEKTIHVHAKTYPTEGDISFPGVDYESCVNALKETEKKTEYDGYWAVEYEEFTTDIDAQVRGVHETLNLLRSQK